ncbi:hypothetical protein GOV05_02950 [Candidatus Woesearchaeota archaeon]|nr:hypothetical protein [Candidatus Woesearchaeota archaeon]
MGADFVHDYDEKIFGIGNKIKGMTPFRTLDSTIEYFELITRFFEECLNKNYLVTIKKQVETSRSNVYINLKGAEALLGVGESHKLIDYFEYKLIELDALVDRFDTRIDAVSKHLNLYPIPHEGLGRLVLNTGKVVMQTKIRTPGFFVFQYAAIRDKNKSLGGVRMTPLHQHGFENIDDAIDTYHDSALWQGLILVDNTKTYPLMHTTLPLIQEKIREEIRLRE